MENAQSEDTKVATADSPPEVKKSYRVVRRPTTQSHRDPVSNMERDPKEAYGGNGRGNRPQPQGPRATRGRGLWQQASRPRPTRRGTRGCRVGAVRQGQAPRSLTTQRGPGGDTGQARETRGHTTTTKFLEPGTRGPTGNRAGRNRSPSKGGLKADDGDG